MSDKEASPSQQQLTIQQALDLAVKHHQAGDLPKAENIYQQILQSDPNQPQALHLLGVIAHQGGHNEQAVELIEKAITLRPDYAEAYNNLGSAFKALGRLDEAVTSYQSALELKPEYPEAYNNLGSVLRGLGRSEEAAICYQQAFTLNPGYAEAHYNLGELHRQLGRLDEATASYREAFLIKPNFVEAHNNYASILREFGELDEAIISLQKAVAINPEDTMALTNLGLVLFDLGRMEEALVNFNFVLEKEPNRLNLNSQLGYVLHALGRNEEAFHHFTKSINLIAEIRLNDPKDETTASISKARVQHDIEQFKYLALLRSEQNEGFDTLANLYADLESEIDWPSESHIQVVLTDDQRQRIRSSYSMPLNLASADRVSGSTLNENLNISKISTSYAENSPNLVVIDDFLTPLALSKLQRFLLESTIWFHFKNNGYIGAQFNDGLACPLLLEIAQELRETFSAIFKNHKLTRLWAYKYDSQRPGINVHADDAAINVNFWVTPNSANLDPNSGGLILYHKAAPEDWPYDVNYTGDDTDHIEKYLEAQNSDKTIVPYAENRAILFNSSLFHETDTIRFKPGYENRRISITLLFGRRPSRRHSIRSPIPKNQTK